MEHQTVSLPRVMVAAPASSSGKTSLTCALLQAALNRGVDPCAFKCGPDYIDPLFHREVLSLPSRNLDLFFSDEPTVRGLMARAGAGHGLAVLEGCMGFYDGIAGTERASSWHLARATDTPVVLTVVPGGTSLTLAAVLQGLRSFRAPDMIQGVILNQCSPKLCRHLTPILERETGLQVLGHIPRMPDCALASRHLGLITAAEVEGLQEKILRLAGQREESVDLDALFAIAASAPPLTASLETARPRSGGGIPIAVARDRAFSFYYEDNLELLEELGAELVEFSPLTSRHLPSGAKGLYLGGGYPELYARQLSRNRALRAEICAAARAGMPVLAECGGFLYLQEELEDENGVFWPMAGVLSGRGKRASGTGRFGYISLTAEQDTPYLPRGETIAAHEFHRWDSGDNGTASRAQKPVTGEAWLCVRCEGALFAGFPHLYFRSNPAFASRFVAACGRFQEGAL